MAAATTTEPTPVRLLDAAEQLIGARGVQAVSLRAINAEAGSNVAAAHYHFGSKEALVRAVLDRRMSVLAEQRSEQLAALPAAPTASDVAAVFVRPLVELTRDEQGARYVRFLAALYRAGGPWFPVLAEAFAAQDARIAPVLVRAVPALADDARRGRRLDLASEIMLRMLADPDRYTVGLDAAGYLDEVTAMFAAVLTAPLHPTEAP